MTDRWTRLTPSATVFTIVVLLLFGIALSFQSSADGSDTDNQTLFSLHEHQPEITLSLAVPNLDQGSTSWCFPTSLTMVLRFFGEDSITPADIAAELRKSEDEGASFFDVFLGNFDRYMSRQPAFEVSKSVIPWDFDGYVECLTSGVPVVDSSYWFPGHALIVVGYFDGINEPELIVHDPSGYLTSGRWVAGTNEFAIVPWDKFSEMYCTRVVVQPIESNPK